MTAAFDLDTFVGALRRAAAGDAPVKAVRGLLGEAIADPARLSAAMPDFEEDDTLLFEDETVTVYHVRFPIGLLVPPHDHRITAIIGVYDGAEENRLYRRGDPGLELVRTKRVGPGEILTIGPDGIHAVQADGGRASNAIHVYLGSLNTVGRFLYDWETGAPEPFTDEAYERLKVEH